MFKFWCRLAMIAHEHEHITNTNIFIAIAEISNRQLIVITINVTIGLIIRLFVVRVLHVGGEEPLYSHSLLRWTTFGLV